MEETKQVQNANAPEEKPQGVDKKVKNIFDYVEMLAIAVAVVVILISFVFRLTVVVGGSMEQTLQPGQVLVITNLFYKPKTGDIIVIQPMTTDYTNPIIKRVIATEGQVVDIDFYLAGHGGRRCAGRAVCQPPERRLRSHGRLLSLFPLYRGRRKAVRHGG